MSGTSLDGISAAVVRFEEGTGSRGEGRDRLTVTAATLDRLPSLSTELLAFVSVPYSADQRARLLAATEGVSPAEYCRLNFDLGDWLAAAAVAALAEAGVARADVAAVASHGQTVWHEPGHSTWQLGEAAVIAERTGVDVIDDFRVRDVAANGQGAPLVPIADALLFAAPDQWRALQNLGGIGNVTVVPPGGDLAALRAFDTGPGVAVIDGVVRQLVPGLPYDVDGRLALAGVAVGAVVDELLAAPYFHTAPPKSTAR
jgi:anhydro-N-acetylmuramic acid kinase